MKFRAVMIDVGPLREFSNIVSTISKLSKECVFRLSDDRLYFIVSDENSNPAPPVLWCEIPQNMFFSEYQLVGLDEEHQDIYLGLNPEKNNQSVIPSAEHLENVSKPLTAWRAQYQSPIKVPYDIVPTLNFYFTGNLAKSLITLKSAKCLKMKLTKKQCPCLTLEIELLTSGTQTRQVTHDLPVVVIPRKMWSDFHEPRVPTPDISIELPPLKQLRTTIDRMRTMSSEVMVRASAEGRLTLQIKTDVAKVSTRFKDLRVEAFEGPVDHSDSETETQVNEDMSKVCFCRIDAKKLSMFLSADQIAHNQTICSIVHKRLAVLCLHTDENVKLQCFITGIVF